MLIHYNPNLPLKLDYDSSTVGLGSVLLHVMQDVSERPIAYASRSFSKAERNYSQIEKEALSIVWTLHKFHQYLYLNKFIDHKHLTVLFKPDKAIPAIASGGIQRWALLVLPCFSVAARAMYFGCHSVCHSVITRSHFQVIKREHRMLYSH